MVGPFIVLIIHHSSFIIYHLSFIIYQSSFINHHSFLPVVEAARSLLAFQRIAHIISDIPCAAGHSPVGLAYNALPHSVIAFPSACVGASLTIS